MQVKKQVVFSDGDLHLWRLLLQAGGVTNPERYDLGESPEGFNFSGTFKGILMTYKVINDLKQINININPSAPMMVAPQAPINGYATPSAFEGVAYPPQQHELPEEEEEEEEDIDPEDCGFAS
ncbi:hypothetical protein GCM10011571_32860 [Marinithermofilum abyssi]|uniref:Uncharacterized protein n=1 Tax=Marinithermofilum abyssi TaxID=1571185 RepID=A0A8J2YEE1_9BACL|nr:hypothetical protein [Marinithermofilum abyssi]GGE28177.1 hypothetical protein GCM10011571_32860 [Marinithermofilum abyssi]